MQNKLRDIFRFLDDNEITYFLLRPVDVLEGFNDIDLVIQKPVFRKLVKLLPTAPFEVRFKYSSKNETIILILDDIILDIQLHVAFYHYKSLVLYKNCPHSKVDFEDDRYFVTQNHQKEMFTFWTFRLFLDRRSVNDFSSLEKYRIRYQKNWAELMDSSVFKEWVAEVFKDTSEQATVLITTFFKNGMKDEDADLAAKIKQLTVAGNPWLRFKLMFDGLKYRILRRLGRYARTNDISRISL